MQNGDSRYKGITVVEASAGSGKTFALSKRYIALLFYLKESELPVRNILAITFTNKATIEMKERIISFLKKIAFNSYKDGSEKNELLEAAGPGIASLQEDAKSLIEKIICNYDFFQVQTIDSFVNHILKSCSEKLGVSAVFEIEKDYREKLLLALDELLEESVKDQGLKTLFSDFVGDYIASENMPKWFPKNDIHDKISLLYEKSSSLGSSFVYDKTFKEESNLRLRKLLLSKMEVLLEVLPEHANKQFTKSLAAYFVKINGRFTFKGLSEYFKRANPPLNQGYYPSKEALGKWDEIRGLLGQLAESESANFFNNYLRIYTMLSARLERNIARENTIFLNQLNYKASSLFKQKDFSVPELYYRISSRYRHLLLDEFQDTSELQWENVRPIADEVLATGGSLFYVGDKKQAIYRFRGGESELFDMIPQQLRHYGVETQKLETNFRSCKVIVDFVNGVFSGMNISGFLNAISEKNISEKAGKYADKHFIEQMLAHFSSAGQHADRKTGGYVRVDHLKVSSGEEPAEMIHEAVYARLKELNERCSWKDIGILVRKNDEVQRLTAYLVDNGVPVESEQTLNIRENPTVKEIVSFMRYIISPLDEIAFASFISGRIFSKVSGLDAGAIASFVFENRSKKGKTLYIGFREKYPVFWESYFDKFFVSSGLVPAYEFTISFLKTFGVMENFKQDTLFVMKFLQTVKESEQESTALGAFMEYFENIRDEELYLSLPSANSVRIMTMHKAKGLQFPCVILPFFEVLASKSAEESHYIVKSDEGLRLFRLKEDYADYSDKINELCARRFRQNMEDELNLCYVSLTRAMDELHIFVPDKISRSKNLAKYLINDESIAMGEPGIARDGGEESKAAVLLEYLAPRYTEWYDYLHGEKTFAAGQGERERLLHGELAHAVLSHIGSLAGKNAYQELDEAVSMARERYPNYKKYAELKSMLAELVSNEKFSHIFAPDGFEVKNEFEVVDENGATRRVDRLLVSPREIIIVDYKSSKEGSNSHKEQLENYRNIISKIYSCKNIRCILVYMSELELVEL